MTHSKCIFLFLLAALCAFGQDTPWTVGGVNFSGYVDAYANINFNNPSTGTQAGYRTFDNRANTFSLNMATLTAQHDADPIGFRVDLGFGREELREPFAHDQAVFGQGDLDGHAQKIRGSSRPEGGGAGLPEHGGARPCPGRARRWMLCLVMEPASVAARPGAHRSRRRRAACPRPPIRPRGSIPRPRLVRRLSCVVAGHQDQHWDDCGGQRSPMAHVSSSLRVTIDGTAPRGICSRARELSSQRGLSSRIRHSTVATHNPP